MKNESFPVCGDGGQERFKLTRTPNGVYCVDGRSIPICDNGAISLNDGEPVIDIHGSNDNAIGICGAVLGVYIKK